MAFFHLIHSGGCLVQDSYSCSWELYIPRHHIRVQIFTSLSLSIQVLRSHIIVHSTCSYDKQAVSQDLEMLNNDGT